MTSAIYFELEEELKRRVDVYCAKNGISVKIFMVSCIYNKLGENKKIKSYLEE